jgi:hypothetical protein
MSCRVENWLLLYHTTASFSQLRNKKFNFRKFAFSVNSFIVHRRISCIFKSAHQYTDISHVFSSQHISTQMYLMYSQVSTVVTVYICNYFQSRTITAYKMLQIAPIYVFCSMFRPCLVIDGDLPSSIKHKL